MTILMIVGVPGLIGVLADLKKRGSQTSSPIRLFSGVPRRDAVTEQVGGGVFQCNRPARDGPPLFKENRQSLLVRSSSPPIGAASTAV